MPKHDPFSPDQAVKPMDYKGEGKKGASSGEKIAGTANTSAPSATQPAPQKATEVPPAGSTVPANEDGVPEGTIKEVLAWVGDDKDKAQKALDAEKASDDPRKGLVSDLEERLA